MKRLWARVGVIYEIPDDLYVQISNAIKNNNSFEVAKLIEDKRIKSYYDGDRYLPYECEDNPNTEEFNF